MLGKIQTLRHAKGIRLPLTHEEHDVNQHKVITDARALRLP